MNFSFLSGLALGLLLMTSCVSRNSAGKTALQRFEFEKPQMGVLFRMVLYAPNEEAALTAATAAYKRVEDLNAIMSDYESESELSKLSQSAGKGMVLPVSPDLWRVLQRAQELAQRSDGAFDISVGPYVSLWKRARRIHRLPEPERFSLAQKAVGYRNIRLNAKDHTAELLVPGMRLDLGGIAKGFAVDEALKVLTQQGVQSALVAGSGDTAVSAPPPGRKGWIIELEIPDMDLPGFHEKQKVCLSHAAIATSGDLYQRLEIDGRRYSHIVDPRTGIGLTDSSLVNVIAKDCMTADSLTKVVSVLGSEKGMAFMRKTRGVEVRIIRPSNGRIEKQESSGFGRYYAMD